MDREIKFRAWDGERMIYFDTLMIDFDKDIKPFFRFENDTLNGTVKLHEHIDMQYTGLKDKNDTEIYEGDIVQYEIWHGSPQHFLHEKDNPDEDWKRPFEVFYDSDLTKFRIRPLWTKDYQTFDLTKYLHNEGLEVIGNIYENEELLNQPV